MKKLIAIILALVMALAMTSVAFAADEGEGGTGGDTKNTVSGTYYQEDGTTVNKVGTITINKYNSSNNYAIYRMLNLMSFTTADGGKYSYVVNDGWEGFFIGEKDGAGNVTKVGAGAEYVTFNGKYVTWNTAKLETEAPTFAKKALEYVKAKKADADRDNEGKNDNEKETRFDPIAESNHDAGVTTDGYPTYTFDNLPLGYYLVDSTMGALCGLTTTNPDAAINAKNGEPTMVKKVNTNTATIGQPVQFELEITIAAGAENFVIHDDLDDGFTLNKDSIQVFYNGSEVTNPEANENPVDEGEEPGEEGGEGSGDAGSAEADYKKFDIIINPEIADTVEARAEHANLNCDFEVKFTKDFCDTLENGKTLKVTYSAMLNDKAFIGKPSGKADEDPGNINTATLAFGEDHFTAFSEVVVETYAFDLVKTDSQNSLLSGAFFKMQTLKDDEDGKEDADYETVKLTKVITDAENNKYYYRPWLSGDETAVVEEFEVEGGMIRVQGFAPGDYYFYETKEPAGYNKLSERAKFTLSNYNKDALFNGTVYSSGSGFHITNSNGVMLPETGGIGTLLFTALGGTTALGAGVVLVTKKRMSKIKDDEE